MALQLVIYPIDSMDWGGGNRWGARWFHLPIYTDQLIKIFLIYQNLLQNG